MQSLNEIKAACVDASGVFCQKFGGIKGYPRILEVRSGMEHRYIVNDFVISVDGIGVFDMPNAEIYGMLSRTSSSARITLLLLRQLQPK